VSSPSPVEPDGLLDGLRWSCILGGAVLDHVLTFLALLPVLVWVGGAEAFSGNEESVNRAIDQTVVAPEFLLWSFIVGTSVTSFAAFWASRRAGVLYLRHGGWTAVAAAILGSIFLLLPGATSGPQPPFWYVCLGYAFIVPAGVFGGWLAAKASETAT